MPGKPNSRRSASTAGVMTPRSSATNGQLAEIAPEPRRRERAPGPGTQRPVTAVSRAGRDLPVGLEARGSGRGGP